jgi:hypothetical protein
MPYTNNAHEKKNGFSNPENKQKPGHKLPIVKKTIMPVPCGVEWKNWKEKKFNCVFIGPTGFYRARHTLTGAPARAYRTRTRIQDSSGQKWIERVGEEKIKIPKNA